MNWNAHLLYLWFYVASEQLLPWSEGCATATPQFKSLNKRVLVEFIKMMNLTFFLLEDGVRKLELNPRFYLFHHFPGRHIRCCFNDQTFLQWAPVHLSIVVNRKNRHEWSLFGVASSNFDSHNSIVISRLHQQAYRIHHSSEPTPLFTNMEHTNTYSQSWTRFSPFPSHIPTRST